MYKKEALRQSAHLHSHMFTISSACMCWPGAHAVRAIGSKLNSTSLSHNKIDVVFGCVLVGW